MDSNRELVMVDSLEVVIVASGIDSIGAASATDSVGEEVKVRLFRPERDAIALTVIFLPRSEGFMV